MNTTYTSKFQRDILLDGEMQPPASQPPPLTQGRMYVEVSQFADAVQKEISIQNEKFKGDPLFSDNDALVMGYVFLAIERLKENYNAVPHTPAQAVSEPLDYFKEVIRGRIKHFRGIYHTFEANKLQGALNIIIDLVPPSNFAASIPAPIVK